MPRIARGFTLIEILVVVFIIGIISAGVFLSMNIGGSDRRLEDEKDRLVALIDYAREQAELQTREYGLRFHEKGYEFLVLDMQKHPQVWERAEDDALRKRPLPPGLSATLRIEGREIVLPEENAKDRKPQVMLFSSGDLNAFDLRVMREGSDRGFRIHVADNEDEIVNEDLPERRK